MGKSDWKIAFAGLFLLGGHPLDGEHQRRRQEILPTLTTAAAVQGLLPSESSRRYPVRLRAVCVVCFPGWHGFFVNDGSTGVYVETKDQVLLTNSIHTGSELEIEGVTGPGDFSPIVDQAVVRVLGEGRVPPARRVSLDRLSTGAEDGQWIEIEGTVRSADTSNTMLTLAVASGQLQVDVMTPRYTKQQYLPLVDAKVSIRGTAGPVFNSRRQLIGVNVYTPSLEDVRVLEPAPVDTFALPVRPVRNVFAYAPGTAPDHQVRIRGVVTALWPGKALYVTDGIQGASVLSSQMTPLELGDRVDVTGFPGLGDYTPTLHEAAFRRLGSGPPPVSRPITAKDALSGDFDGDLVRIDARLIKQTRGTDQGTFFLDSGGNFFSAIVQTDRAGSERDLRDGSRLQLTGICAITETQPVRHFRVPRAFQILLRSPKDILVLEKPSWWTTEHAVYTLVIITAIIMSALLWVIAVRRQLKRLVQQRTSELQESHQQLQVMATHDGLTQLWNRNAIMGILATALARRGRENSTLAVVMVDLDEFKAINDTYGHLAGDAVLREVSNRFQSAIRPYDSVGRYGGEELLLVLPGIPITEVRARIQQIQWRVCGAPIPAVEGRVTVITCSFGVFCVDGEDPSLDYVISHADAALYRAKALGRNRIEYAEMKSAVLD